LLFGFLLIDKAAGMNSFGIVRSMRKMLGIKRIGYAGILDPLASGLMIVALGEATKLLPYLEKMDKIYEVEVMLGAISKTYDAEGPLTDKDFKSSLKNSLKKSDLEKVIEEHFSGERLQKPPIYSAVKIAGKHAYALARQGRQVDLKMRMVTFFEIRVKRFFWPKLLMTVHAASGTYIRSFAHDLGQILGCGGYVANLRRTKIGRFSVKHAVPFAEITAQNIHRFLLTPQEFLPDWPQLQLSGSEYQKLGNGGFIEDKNALTHEVPMSQEPILAIFQGNCVGILETVNQGAQLKFRKKFTTVGDG